jgi:chromodomain-helicase-DNA-binding protein 7
LLLTGTPIQNNLKELWTMLHFLDAKAFPSMEKFLAKYQKDESGKYQAEDIMRLREKIQPYLLKRDKEDVDLQLPEKEETVSRRGKGAVEW